MGKGRLKIFLGDLTHTSVAIASDTFPLNIGFLAMYANKTFGREVDIRLFKYPENLLTALKEDPPQILGLSNYPWCRSLSESILSFSRKLPQPPITLLGGSSYPADPKDQEQYLKDRPVVDFYIYMEGERSFCRFIERFMNCGGNISIMQRSPLAGCHFIRRQTGEFVKGDLAERIQNLDDIPSPYLSGSLDDFFNHALTPMIQTNRGCPFTCTFCHEGRDYFNKVYLFSLDRIKEDLFYIGKKCRDSGVKTLQVADSNFAMYPQDLEICQAIHAVREKTGWPVHIMVSTGKNMHDRIIQSIDAIGDGIAMSMSVQSMDEDVLKSIKRSNIRLGSYIKIHDELKRRNRYSFAEVILCLPGETRESHLQGIKTLIDTRVNSVKMYTLMLLDGTELNTRPVREKYGLKGKFRILPRDFGDYHGVKSIEIEEVCMETNTLSFQDYLYARGFHLLVACYYNEDSFGELVNYLVQKDVSPFDWLMKLYNGLGTVAPFEVTQTVHGFIQATRDELWNSPQELLDFYMKPENYEKLVRGEAGENLLYNACGRIYSNQFEIFLDYGISAAFDLLSGRFASESEKEECHDQLMEIRKFIWNKLSDLFNVEADPKGIEEEFRYDILRWKEDQASRPFEEYRATDEPRRYLFTHTEHQRHVLQNAVRRYGSTPRGLEIILSRAIALREMFRTAVRVDQFESVQRMS